jgi:hypothetical protein
VVGEKGVEEKERRMEGGMRFQEKREDAKLVEEFGRTYVEEAGFRYRMPNEGDLISNREMTFACVERNDQTGRERHFLLAVVTNLPHAGRRLLAYFNGVMTGLGEPYWYRLRD